jgi:hypothetical protein
MCDAKASTPHPIMRKLTVLSLATGLAAAVLAAVMVIVASPLPAQATPAFSAKTGLPCGRCHTSPAGGDLTNFGKTFRANGNKLPKGK